MVTVQSPWHALLDDLVDGKVRGRLAAAGAATICAFMASVGLLALAGWYIAASAVAGLAVASAFSFLYPTAGVRALAVVRTLGRYFERISSHAVTLDVASRLRTRLFERALLLPQDTVAAMRSGELLGRITIDVDAVEQTLLRVAFPTLVVIAAIVAAGGLAAFSLPVAIVALTGLALTWGVTIVVSGPRTRSPAHDLVHMRAQARLALVELIDGLPELRSFGAERLAADEVLRNVGRAVAGKQRLSRLAAQGRAVIGLLADSTLLGAVLVAAGLLVGPRLSAPIFVLVCLACIALFEPLAAVPAAVGGLAQARSAVERLADMFSADMGTASGRWVDMPEGALIVNVHLASAGVGFAAWPGNTVLLRGRSGCGKTTFLRAIAGEPVPGVRALIAGTLAASIEPAELVAKVTIVAQDAHVFDGTIRDNLLLGGRVSDDVFEAVMAAVALPLPLDTPVGPDGAALSGGQRRRLSVAQAMLRRPEVLLLDEPTEGMDNLTAARLLAGVRNFLPGAVLVIALHDRQAQLLPWPVHAQIDLDGGLVGPHRVTNGSWDGGR
jgi:ATP-binding cassette subfamily C protein CydC